MSTDHNASSEIAKTTSFGAWTLKDILTYLEQRHAVFRIPDYQRGYAWGIRQLEEFWDDLTSITNNKHYTGALTVEKASEGILDVVDGQQRLTTMAILISVLEDDGKDKILSRLIYGEGNDNRKFFSDLLKLPAFVPNINSGGSTSHPAPSEFRAPKNLYQRNLVNAKSFFSGKVANQISKGELSREALTNLVLNNLSFDFRILGSEFDSGIVFETMNNRGKPLTLLEKLKNRLMYLAKSIGGGEYTSIRDKVNSAWGRIYRKLASDPDHAPLDENEFVAAHLSVYRNPKESAYSEAVAEARLFKMFCRNPERHPKSEDVDESSEKAMAKAVREEELTLDKIEKYVDNLNAFAPAWAAIHRQYDNACGRCRLLSGTREVKTFLASVWLALTKEAQVERIGDDTIFQMAEELLFRNTVLNVIDESAFATWGRRIHGTCLDQLKGGDSSPVTIEGLRDEMESSLQLEKRQIDAAKLVGTFSDFMNRRQAPFGFYRWPGLKYFLFTQEEGNHALSWGKFGETSLEHIIPQSSIDSEEGWWSRQISEFVTPQTDDNPNGDDSRQLKRKLVNTLGNFVLLSQSENASVSDDPWERYDAVEGSHGTVIGKKAFYGDAERSSSAGARAVANETNGSWNAYCVRKRGRELFRILAKQLGVEGVPDDQIDMALGFNAGMTLSDTQFESLPEGEVQRLAPRFGTAAEPRRGPINGDGMQSLINNVLPEVLKGHSLFFHPQGLPPANFFSYRMQEILPPLQDGMGHWTGKYGWQGKEIYRFWMRPMTHGEGVRIVLELAPGPENTDKKESFMHLLDNVRENMRRIGGKKFENWLDNRNNNTKISINDFNEMCFEKKCAPNENAVREAVRYLLNQLAEWQASQLTF